MQHSFNFKFWLGALSTAIPMLALLVAIAILSANDLPKPALPAWGRSYLTGYNAAQIDHYLFRFGLFGFGDRIKKADVLILGSSHALFGISAEMISTALSRQRGNSVTAFNLAVGGDGLGFAREVLEAKRTHGQTLLLDVYSNDGGLLSPAARKVLQADILVAYVGVALATTEFARDWLFDKLLPRIDLGDGAKPRVERSLRPVVTRRWDNGDLDDLWTPEHGSLFRNPPQTLVSRLRTDPRQPKGPHLALLPEYRDYLVSRDSRVVLTLVPYNDYRVDEAKLIAEQTGRPFLHIESGDLQSLDGGHLNARSRAIVTRRLLDRLFDQPAR
jgi:hypothetical protein